MGPALRRALTLAKATAKRAKLDRVNDGAAAVVYWTVLALAPLALTAAALIGSLSFFIGESAANSARTSITDFLDSNLGGTSASGLSETIKNLLDQPRAGLAIVGVLLAIWGARRAFAAFFRTLGRIARNDKMGMGAKGQLAAVGLGLATVGLTVVALMQLTLGPLFGFAVDNDNLLSRLVNDAWTWVRFPLMVVLLVAWLGVVLAHGTGRGWKRSLPGAVLSTILLFLASVGFQIYARLAANANAVLGLLGGVIVLLTWLYFQVISVLFGAELNAVLADEERLAAEPPPPPPPPVEPRPDAQVAGLGILVAAVLSGRRR